jgi:hypothetical protein
MFIAWVAGDFVSGIDNEALDFSQLGGLHQQRGLPKQQHLLQRVPQLHPHVRQTPQCHRREQT